MSDKPKHLITTAIAYANAGPHIGHALEFVVADAHARARREHEAVHFITGMDEHGQKIEQKAKEANEPVQDFVNKNAQLFKDLDQELEVSYDFFVRTSDTEKHYVGAQYLWNEIAKQGMLEKRSYKALYCVGCEEFKTEKDLNEKGECPNHLKKPEVVEEENWFFKLSQYTDLIKQKIEQDELKIYPEARKNEILALLERGLEDVSFSRPKSKVSWGIPVPGDDEQVMYVWCDALSNYITAIGYGTPKFDQALWENTTHIIGKDILRFHAAIWPGMLLAAGLPLPKRIVVHGFITSGGQKMSKSLGNVISPNEVIELFRPVTKYPGEVLRFILLHDIPAFEDGDLTIDSIKASYAAHLQNGIGNLTSRIMKMAVSNNVNYQIGETKLSVQYKNLIKNYDLKRALDMIMVDLVNVVDKKIQDEEPFKVIKVNKQKGEEIITQLVAHLWGISSVLLPFMPQTAQEIQTLIKERKMPESPLFNRLP